ncbi:hypothetical protein HY213_04970 [Candidatus Peregrinibacteria bacterium]|nr:hypothetical protein [Candidatus Peregrinibacteria bacterium]
MSTRFLIVSSIFEQFPDVMVGILVCRDLTNPPSVPEVTTLLRDAEARLRSRIASADALKEHPTIAAWQEIHRRFGSNPNKFPPSIQALAKRVLKGGTLPTISTLVDLYNVASLTFMIPAGGEDLDQASGDITLTFAEGTEPFQALGESENESPNPGEVVYRDSAGVICRRWNWREGARTRLTQQTKNAVLVLEAVPPNSRSDLETALDVLSAHVQRFCGGTIREEILDRNQQGVEV